MYSLLHLSGRQLLPNVLASLAFDQSNWLDRVVILHSSNTRESKEPAQRLIDLLLLRPSDDEPLPCLQVEVDETLQSVTEEVLALFEEFPKTRWILNLSGGTKMMSAALLLLAAHPKVEAAIYRDITYGWRRCQLPVGAGTPTDSPVDPADPLLGALLSPDLALDRLPLQALVQAQFASTDSIGYFRSKEIPKDASPDDWLVTYQGARAPSFTSYRYWTGGPRDEGPAFECWCACVLRAAGASEVLWSCEGFSPQGLSVMETDVIAVRGNRIAIYDSKLEKPTAPNKSDQIRSARSTADRLGGLSATAVLVRPNWPATQHLEDFANALGVQLINRGNAANLVPALCAPLGLGLPPSGSHPLNRAHAIMQQLSYQRSQVLFTHG